MPYVAVLGLLLAAVALARAGCTQYSPASGGVGNVSATYYLCTGHSVFTCPAGTYAVAIMGDGRVGACDDSGNIVGDAVAFGLVEHFVPGVLTYTSNTSAYASNSQTLCTSGDAYMACAAAPLANYTVSAWSPCYGCYAARTVGCVSDVAGLACTLDGGTMEIAACTQTAPAATPAPLGFCSGTDVPDAARTCTELGGSCRYQVSMFSTLCADTCTVSSANWGCIDTTTGGTVSPMTLCGYPAGVTPPLGCTGDSCPLACAYRVGLWSPCSTGVETRTVECLGACDNATCAAAGAVPASYRACGSGAGSSSSSSSSADSCASPPVPQPPAPAAH